MRIGLRGLTFDVTIGGDDGRTPVLLLHGFPQNASMWGAVAAPLQAAGLRTIALNQRGYSPGARPAEVAAYRPAECVADAVALLDELCLDSVHVVGHDWGAIVGWGLAARHPDRVRSLTAVSVPHPRAYVRALFTSPDQLVRSTYLIVLRSPGRAEDLLLADGASRLRGVFVGSGLDRATLDRYIEPLREPGALTAALNWYRAVRLRGETPIGPVSVPTTYLWSGEDLAIGRAAARRCADHVLAEYRFVQLPGAGHWIPELAPGAVVDAVLATTGTGTATRR
jgi:pimeloyl-ACP methyl ester carboxylesterase